MEAIPKLDKKGLRQFGFMFGGIIAGLFGIVLPWLFDFKYPYWPWGVLLVFFKLSYAVFKIIDLGLKEFGLFHKDTFPGTLSFPF